MPVNNHRLSYRPLLAGTMISSSEIRRSGTIACFASSDGVDTWALTAAHVVSASKASFLQIGQPDFADPQDLIADPGTPIQYAAGNMDVAAFKIANGIACSRAILELGEWDAVVPPVTGMSVIKSGCTTGVTRGRIGGVRQTDFDVFIEPGMPPGYVAFGPGDSGAAWLLAGTTRLVGIHADRVVQGGFGVAMRLDKVLPVLGLALL